MKRRILNLLSLLSLLLCLATTVAWGRGHFAYDEAVLRIAGRGVAIAWPRGEIAIGFLNKGAGQYAGSYFARSLSPMEIESVRGIQGLSFHSVAGFGWFGFSGSHVAFLPAWFVTLIFLAFPLWWFRFERRKMQMRERERAGLCVRCGYDLRASPERCPECGTPIAPSVGPAC